MQKQEATILSAELSGFQSLAKNLSTQEIEPLINKIHKLIETTVRLHNGKLNRFAGDTFLAAFRFNKTSKRASVNAIDSAFEIKDQLPSLIRDKKIDRGFRLKIGIASGNIISTDIGSEEKKQETIMGEAVNHANRICRFAGENQILVDDKIYEATKEAYEFQILEPIPLKGGTDSLAIFEPLKKKRKKLDLKITTERKIASEMVGRGREAEQLEGLIKKLIDGKGSVVNIVGKAGIGKSRLLAEMKVQALMEKVILLEGRALSTGQNLCFHPLIHLIKSWAGITEEDLPTVSSEKLKTGIFHVAPGQADDIYAFLATMMGLPLTDKAKERVSGIEGEALEKLILKNLRDLIITASKEKPRIYMIEDMHWSDSSSIAFFESLYKLSQKHPVMFINVMRPGYKETSDYILKYLVDNLPGDHVTINLNLLEDSVSGQLINNLLRKTHLPAHIEKMIIRKTEGNPFYIEEIIRSFLDEGIIEARENEFLISDKINEVNIPETINEVILSRVDKLDEKTKDLLKTASVIGRNFYFKVLEEAADTIGELDDRIEYLKDVQLIGESKKKEELEFLFKHALAQQATYESIILNTKKELHLKIARSIEKVFTENLNEHYGSLAYHYEKAENTEKTEEYLIKAGDQALGTGASSDAIGFFKKALKLYLEPSHGKVDNIKLRDLYLKLSIAYHLRGMSNETIESLDKTLALYGYKIPKNKVHLMVVFIRNFFQFIFATYNEKLFFKKPPTKEMDIVLSLIQYRAEAISTISPKRFFIETFYFSNLITRIDQTLSPRANSLFIGFTMFFFWTGISLKISSRIFKTGEKFLDKNNAHVYLNYRYLKKMHDYHCGIIEKDKDLDIVYKTGIEKGLYWETNYYLFFNGFCFADSGERQMCNMISERLLHLANQFDNSQIRATYYRLITYTFIKFREMDVSFDVLEEGVELTRKTEHKAYISAICSNLSILYTLNGNLAQAKGYLDEAEQHVMKMKVAKPFYGPWLLAKTKYEFAILRSLDQYDNSSKNALEKILRELIKTAQKFKGLLPEALLLKAQVSLFFNKHPKAFKSLKEAKTLAEKNGGKVDLSRIYFELGKFLSDPKTKHKQLGGLSGNDYLEKARAMFEEMDLQWDLEEYRKFVEK